MAVLQMRLYAERGSARRPMAKPVGLYWLCAGAFSLTMWALIFTAVEVLV